MHIYIYICIYMYICVHIYAYITNPPDFPSVGATAAVQSSRTTPLNAHVLPVHHLSLALDHDFGRAWQGMPSVAVCRRVLQCVAVSCKENVGPRHLRACVLFQLCVGQQPLPPLLLNFLHFFRLHFRLLLHHHLQE